ncbi:DUF3291 domain-containing protein [Streptomyces sp. NPDC048111]|uniref:DUF3291 domain-containing protein n=1 Tax=Streptomyces sp. NPDC048111 TaxID=3365500 RepID=UPI0037161858
MTASVPVAHLAHLNVATLRHPLDDPRTAPFVALLDSVNASADAAPGFVWRLVEEGEADATGLRPAGENVVVTLSVWESPQALWDFTYRSGHLAAMQRRRDWFERPLEAHLVLWWVPVGHRPSVEEALQRLTDLRTHGPSPRAFTFTAPFTAAEAAQRSEVACTHQSGQAQLMKCEDRPAAGAADAGALAPASRP